MVYNVGMKKIGVLVYKMTNEYALDILSGIYSFFRDKDDVQVFVVQTNSPMADNNYYDYQSWTGVNLLFAEAVDAIIVITGSYASCITTEQMNQLLCNFKTKPIILLVQISIFRILITRLQTAKLLMKMLFLILKISTDAKKLRFSLQIRQTRTKQLNALKPIKKL